MKTKDPIVTLQNTILRTDHPELCKVVDCVQQEEPLPGVEEAVGGHGAEQEDSMVITHRLNLNNRIIYCLWLPNTIDDVLGVF